MRTLSRSGLRLAATGTAAAALTLAAAAPALAQDPIGEVEPEVGADFGTSWHPSWQYALVEPDQEFALNVWVDYESDTDEAPSEVVTVLDLTPGAGAVDLDLDESAPCVKEASVITCTELIDSENADGTGHFSSTYTASASLGPEGEPGDTVPFSLTVSLDGEPVFDETDELQVSEDYGNWEYDPRDEYSTDHEPGDYDLSLTDTTIAGESGEVVDLVVEIANLGPMDARAPIHHGAGEGYFYTAVQLPTGAGIHLSDYVSTPDYYCSVPNEAFLEHNSPEDYGVDRIDLFCFFETVPVDGGVSLEFPVEILDTSPATDGLVTVTENLEIDADYSNNLATLSLNSGDTGSGDESDSEAKEDLPKTGNSSIVMISAAAAAIAAGAVVFFVLRRRRVAQNWE